MDLEFWEHGETGAVEEGGASDVKKKEIRLIYHFRCSCWSRIAKKTHFESLEDQLAV